MKPEAPNSMQRRIAAGSSLADTTMTGTLGILRAQIHQAGKTAHARHGQVEQDEIDVAAALEQFGDLVEGAGFRDIDAFEQTGDRLAQRAAEQRMVVGDHQPILLLAAPLIELSLASARRSAAQTSASDTLHRSMFHPARFVRKCLVARDKLPFCHRLVQLQNS